MHGALLLLLLERENKTLGNRILEITGTVVILSLVLYNAGPFSQVTEAIANAYTQTVKTLVGRA